jgi:hypothetical protein
VNQANQAALTLTPTTGLRTGVTIGTSGGSGSGAVSYSVTTGTASNCAINSNSGVLTATTSGTCLVTATKAASTDYLSATTGAVTVTLSNAGTYSGSNSDLPSGTGDYFAINTLNSVGSTTSTANPTTPGVTEHLTGLTFTIDASSSQTHSATVGIITSGVWAPTALTCTIAANSGLTSCTVSGSVNVPVGSSINVLVVSGSIAHIGTWSTTWTQP